MPPLDKRTVHVAKRYTPKPYWGCPNCGGSAWGAINPTRPNDEELVYQCHGHRIGLLKTVGCGALFTMPDEAYE